MPDFTLASVYTLARAALGDNATAGGQLFTNTKLLPHAQQAFRDILSLCKLSPLSPGHAKRETFLLVPALTNSATLDAGSIGIGYDSLLWVWDRGGVTSVSITGVTGYTVPLMTFSTSAAHGRAVGDIVEITGVALRGLNGSWSLASPTSGSSFSISPFWHLNSAAPSPSSGQLLYSTEKWLPVEIVPTLIDSQTRESRIHRVTVMDGRVMFRPSVGARELRIIHTIHADEISQDNDLIGIDGAFSFMAYRCAELAAGGSGGTMEKKNALREEVWGRNPGSNVSNPLGGYAKSFVLEHMKASQRASWPRTRWRPKQPQVGTAWPSY